MIKNLEIIYIKHIPCAVNFHQFYDSNSGNMVWRADAVEYNCFIQEDTKENARWRIVAIAAIPPLPQAVPQLVSQTISQHARQFQLP